jgi:hypothetical protein
MGDMEGSNRSPAQSLAAAQAARNSYNQQHQQAAHQAQAYGGGGGANNGDTAVEIERRRGHIQGDVAEEQTCTIRLYTHYFRNVLGILRLVELVGVKGKLTRF